jgi:hypothetical protein
MSLRYRPGAIIGVALTLAAPAAPAAADELWLTNGDHLNGQVVKLVEGKLTFQSEVLGELQIDATRIRTLATVQPIEIHAADGTVVRDAAVSAKEGSFRTAGTDRSAPVTFRLAETESINPPPVEWIGALVAGAQLKRGNSVEDESSVELRAVRESKQNRITLQSAYAGTRTEDSDTGERSTTEREIFGDLKYDQFLSERLYWFGRTRGERDGVEDLDLRFLVGSGAGYDWIKREGTRFSTEAGLAWVSDDYEGTDRDDDRLSGLLSWEFSTRPNDLLTAFHRGSWLPSLEELDVMLLYTETGLRVELAKRWFLEGKLRWDWNAEPAQDRERLDVDYILGLGVNF